MNKIDQKAIFPHRLAAGLGMVLLAVVWSFGWFVSPPDLYSGNTDPGLHLWITTLVLLSWNLLSCVIAAGFFHAASVTPVKTRRKFRSASLRLLIIGIVFLFPVPLMTPVLGAEMPGRALALLVTGISLAGIAFGRARINVIGRKLAEMDDGEDISSEPNLEPFS